jgi:hypothetical protein
MSVHLLTIVVLVIVFAMGTVTSVNMGALALVAALVVGRFVLGESVADVLSGFPADLFLLVFGVTYLFGLAGLNGTTELAVMRLVRIVGRRTSAVPPCLFVVTFGAVSMGAVLPALSAVLGSVALGLCRRVGIAPLLGALMVLFGGLAGSFSPITLLGTIVRTTLARNEIVISGLGLYALTAAFNIVFAVFAYALLRGRPLRGLPLRDRRRADPEPESGVALRPSGPAPEPGLDRTEGAGGTPVLEEQRAAETPLSLSPARIATSTAIGVLLCGVLLFGADVGMLALLLAVVLHVAFPSANKAALSQVSWPVIVMLCGVVTYLDLLNRTGTIKATGELLAGLGSPVLAALLLCLVVAAFSAVGSSAAIITAGIALALPLFESGAVGTLGLATALAVSATAVDICPLSSSSALLVANAPVEVRDGLYRGLIRWSVVLAVVAPAATTALLVLPGWI